MTASDIRFYIKSGLWWRTTASEWAPQKQSVVLQISSHKLTDGDLGGLGEAHAAFPPLFWEVLLLDVRQSANWLLKRSEWGICCVLKSRILVKKMVIYVIYQLEKGHQKFWALKWKLQNLFSVPPKLGAKSPPMHKLQQQSYSPKKEVGNARMSGVRTNLARISAWLGFF